MWEIFFKRWLDLAFWWLPRKDEAPPRKPEAAPPQRPQATGETSAARHAPEPPAERPAPATDGGTRGSAGPSVRPAVQPAAPPEKAVTSRVPDDLTVIKGIGPAVQNKLRALGITTFADLAAADSDALLERLKGSQPLTKERVRSWTEAARERT